MKTTTIIRNETYTSELYVLSYDQDQIVYGLKTSIQTAEGTNYFYGEDIYTYELSYDDFKELHYKIIDNYNENSKTG